MELPAAGVQPLQRGRRELIAEFGGWPVIRGPLPQQEQCLLSRGERRNALARDVFHGQRGQLRKHYQLGQETSSTASAS